MANTKKSPKDYDRWGNFGIEVTTPKSKSSTQTKKTTKK